MAETLRYEKKESAERKVRPCCREDQQEEYLKKSNWCTSN